MQNKTHENWKTNKINIAKRKHQMFRFHLAHQYLPRKILGLPEDQTLENLRRANDRHKMLVNIESIVLVFVLYAGLEFISIFNWIMD